MKKGSRWKAALHKFWKEMSIDVATEALVFSDTEWLFLDIYVEGIDIILS